MVFFVGHCFGPLWDRVQNVSVNSKIRCIRASSALLFLCFIEFAVFLLSKYRMNCEIHREKYTKLSITLHIYTSSWQRFRLKVCNWQSFASRKLWWHFVGSVPFHFIWFDSRQNIIITFSVFAFSLGNVLNSKIYACILLHRRKYYRGRCTSNSFLSNLKNMVLFNNLAKCISFE